MIILGLNAYHGDSAACIIVDGKLVAAAEEERFVRIKHWAGLPIESVRYCLESGGFSLEDVDHIAINRNPRANFLKKALFAFRKRHSLSLVSDRLKNAVKIGDIKELLGRGLGVDGSRIKAKVHNVEHHVAHLASSYLVSPLDKAALVSVDGFGDFVGAMWGIGEGNKLEVKGRTFFPHSLGLFYLAFTQYLGFPKYGDEYKVMGLAAYGEPSFMDEMRNIVITPEGLDGFFELDLDFFIHHSEGVSMTWDGGEPKMGPVFSRKLEELLGPARKGREEELTDRHRDIAASLQQRYEEVFFHILNQVYETTGCNRLALAGGCAMNSVANGKVFEKTPFEEVFIHPAAGDAGGAIGAAFYVYNSILGQPREFVLEHAYWGPGFSEAEIGGQLEVYRGQLEDMGCSVEKIEDEGELCRKTAQYIADGKVVGWFQGRMEWGPRALGNRSIVVDPRRAEMKDVLNARIKRREPFRPFAPTILREYTGEYFEVDYPVPFMLMVFKIKPEKREVIPAVTHVDGTGRLQTIERHQNPLYYKLISAFHELTGVPVVLNTSFNENEPIVCNPQEALECFLRTRMDVLVMGKYVISRR